MNVVARLEFELTLFDVTIQHDSHYEKRIPFSEQKKRY